MGAHTAARVALERPGRVAALALITPAFDPAEREGGHDLEHWDALAAGLRSRGVEGFLEASDFDSLPAGWRETVERVIRQRLGAHEHPLAVADALEAVPRSRPFEAVEQLQEMAFPTLVVGSRDEADPSHPLRVAELYAKAIPGADLAVEQSGSPIAWQGGQLSRLLLELAERSE
jgi:pimeloyl-ACP methyl ester carboxylesterase